MPFRFLRVRVGCVLLGWSCLLGSSRAAEPASALPLLNPIFGDNMVLQRDKPNTLWGWAAPGQSIAIEIAGRKATATAGPDGKWTTQIQPPAVGGPYTIRISGPKSLELHNILVGDVWICGGQSNMELGLKQSRDGADAIKAGNHPEIRLFTVRTRPAYAPARTAAGEWRVCTPENLVAASPQGFSAVAYYFAVRIQQDVHVPIGLIQDCVGGSPVESWMSESSLAQLHVFEKERAEIHRLHDKGAPDYGNFIMHWYDEYDPGIQKPEWFSADFHDADWKTVHLIDAFKELGVPTTPAVIWLRRDVELPDPLPPGKIMLSLGVVEKMDTAYINGHWVGASSWVENPRMYNIPRELVHPGKNQITLRILKIRPDGGFESNPEKLHIAFENGPTVSLLGEWKAKLGVDARPPHALPLGYENYPTMPTVLYQGMIAPIAPVGIAGAIWYQGEANATRAYQYRTLLPAMIEDWRNTFQEGDFPFYIVSLPRFETHHTQPVESDWAELREAQVFTVEHVPNTGLAVTIDSGEADNIHPKDKKLVGDRLARIALAKYYKQPIVYQGPTLAGSHRDGHTIKVDFAHAEGGLVVHGEKAVEFSIAGADRVWHWAQAQVDGSSVVVSSPDVAEPVAVRYAWQANPEATLFNREGLPATPFRTDDWPESTQH